MLNVAIYLISIGIKVIPILYKYFVENFYPINHVYYLHINLFIVLKRELQSEKRFILFKKHCSEYF